MSVLNVTEVKADLKILANDTSKDGRLGRFIRAAESAIARRVGPLEPTSVTQRRPGGSSLVLTKMPVLSLTSVTPLGGDPLDLDDLDMDPETGIVEHLSGVGFPARRYVVVYQSGYDPLPNDILQACEEQVRYLWETQRGTAGKAAGGGSAPPEGTSWPRRGLAKRAEELIEPYVLDGFA